MTGGLLQIASAGNQDLYLTSNPKINFFKFFYKRYSNFSIETIPIKFNGLYYFNEMLNCDIPKNGDLILNKDFIANANGDDQILVKLYIKNYNILKINNGLGGLMFN